jgi:hypothetical protein
MAHGIFHAFSQTNEHRFRPSRDAPDEITPNRIAPNGTTETTDVQNINVLKPLEYNCSPAVPQCSHITTHLVSPPENQL